MLNKIWAWRSGWKGPYTAQSAGVGERSFATLLPRAAVVDFLEAFVSRTFPCWPLGNETHVEVERNVALAPSMRMGRSPTDTREVQ